MILLHERGIARLSDVTNFGGFFSIFIDLDIIVIIYDSEDAFSVLISHRIRIEGEREDDGGSAGDRKTSRRWDHACFRIAHVTQSFAKGDGAVVGKKGGHKKLLFAGIVRRGWIWFHSKVLKSLKCTGVLVKTPARS